MNLTAGRRGGDSDPRTDDRGTDDRGGDPRTDDRGGDSGADDCGLAMVSGRRGEQGSRAELGRRAAG